MSPNPMCSVTVDIAAITGDMSCRGHWIPHSTAGSMLPRHVLGTPDPSPKNSMSTPARSAVRATSMYMRTSGKSWPTQPPAAAHRPSVWVKDRS
ncbi:hypothetical protein QP157_20435 [Sphingomonas sp. LR61]